MLTCTLNFLSCSSPWSLDHSAPLHEHKSRGIHKDESEGYSATSAGGQSWQPGQKSTRLLVLWIYMWLVHGYFCCLTKRKWWKRSQALWFCARWCLAGLNWVFHGHGLLLRQWKMQSAPFLASLQTSCYHRLSVILSRAFPNRLSSMSPRKSTPSCSHLKDSCTTRASSRGNKQPHQYRLAFRLALLLTRVFCLYTSCSAQKESTNKANMKRENKAYSYKEQIIEMEIQEVMSFTY